MPEPHENSSVRRHKLWRPSRIGTFLFGGLCFLIVLGFVHPFGNARVVNSRKELMSSAHVERPVLDVMQRSCQDCHSEQTAWPVYSRLAPVSWLIERDVQNGRAHWDMSRWDQYSIDEQEDILSRIGPMVRNRKMPLPQYLFLHPEARLTDADIEVLYQWSRHERKRLKALSEQANK